MISWILFFVWGVAGLIILLTQKKVTKLEYGLVWFCLMVQLIEKCMK